MVIRHFTKKSRERMLTFFTIIILVAAALFITEGCEKSDYEKALNGEDITTLTEASDTAPQNIETGNIKSGETASTGSGNSTTPETTEKSIASDSTSDTSSDIQVLKFAEKSLSLKPLGTFYAKSDTWSMQLEINKETGEATGFIFASYTEASMDGNSTTVNISVLKAALTGTLDMKSFDFKGKVTGNITADRDDYYSGPVDIETTGKISADYRQFTGNFTTPSYVIFDYTLENE